MEANLGIVSINVPQSDIVPVAIILGVCAAVIISLIVMAAITSNRGGTWLGPGEGRP